MPTDTASTTSNSIVYSGFPRPVPGDGHLYEKTSTTYEQVAGYLLMKGTGAHQLKLCANTGAVGTVTPIAVGRIQKFAPGEDSNGKVNTDYATDAKFIRAMDINSPAQVYLWLGPTQTAVIGSFIKQNATTSGITEVVNLALTTRAQFLVVGRALEAVTCGSGETKKILVDLSPFVYNERGDNAA
jgi:hypothetical protein